MKPTPQISHEQQAARSFPLTDYNYQPAEIAGDTPATTAEAPANTGAVRAAMKSPAFHKVSTEFFGAEISRDYVAELLFFVVISGIAAWPVMSMLHAITRMVRNYYRLG